MASFGTPLLLTGFEPFASFDVNPSWESIRFAAETFGPQAAAYRLPVDHHRARETLCELLERHRPAACLCMGLAPSPEFRFELSARKPVQFASLPGNMLLQGNWPWGSMETPLTRMGEAWRRSTDAGAYVCESTYWTLLDFRERNGYPRDAGFLHVPCASEEFPLARTAACVEQILRDYLTRSSSL